MAQQLALYVGSSEARSQEARSFPIRPRRAGQAVPARKLCAACREKEARYGFKRDNDPVAERPRTLCFECFRVEVTRRQDLAARVARGWTGTQTSLPLDETLRQLDRRRRRALIAARHALGL